MFASSAAVDEGPATAPASTPLFDTATTSPAASTPATADPAAAPGAPETTKAAAHAGPPTGGTRTEPSDALDASADAARPNTATAPAEDTRSHSEQGDEHRRDGERRAPEPDVRPATVAPARAGAAANMPALEPLPAPPAPADGPPAASDTDSLADPVLPALPAADAAPGASASSAPARPAPSGEGRPAHHLPMTAAQLRASMERVTGGVNLSNGWQVLEMRLDEGDGTMTIRTHRTDERVAVSVAFSDPSLRALAATQADRLQEALQARYDQQVDLSLMNSGSEHTGSRHPSGQPQGGRDATDGPPTLHAAAVAPAPEKPGLHRTGLTPHEWIG
ncbi:hypothetical protein AWN76_017560 [Rhodothermaceae bacterium RA]|nr:hypothetical protein AWN76_017560 [Rhodothermaceae bacterium RA]